MERFAWYVYALYGVLVVSFILLIINQLRHFRRGGAVKDYPAVERKYLMIDLLSKVAFAAILIVGLKK